MASASRSRSRTRGRVERLPSGSLRVSVYAGIDPVSKKKRHYLVETVPAGPVCVQGRRALQEGRVDLIGPPRLTNQFQSWFRTSPFANFLPIDPLARAADS